MQRWFLAYAQIHTDYIAESEMDDLLMGPKPPPRLADMETWISAGSSTSCRVSVSGRNSISATTFPPRPSRARDLHGDHGRGRFARLTSLERVTTGVGSVSRAARAKPNSLGRSVRPTLRVGKPFPWLYPKIRLNYHSLYLRSTGQTTGVSG